jgi:hypothetical protein
VAFYVPLGPRGMLFRLGTFVIGIWGGLVYQLAYRRRRIITSDDRLPFRSLAHELQAYDPLEMIAPMSVNLVHVTTLIESESPAMA